MSEEKDLILGEPTEDEMEFELVPTTSVEYVNAAVNAYECAESSNPMSATDTQRVKRIKRKSLAILDYAIGELYDELFDKDEED
jgi:hypothetical protein